MDTNTMSVPIQLVEQTLISKLVAKGIPTHIAEKVTNSLIESEAEGHPSHGIIRFLDYCHAIDEGLIEHHAIPIIEDIHHNVKQIDGNKSFGVITQEVIATSLLHILEQEPIAIVSLINSNHIGRLAHISKPLVDQNKCLIGFVNFLGSGKNVVPYGAVEGRLCTNPLIFAFPRKDGEAIVIDMTTSTVSEGKIRHAAMNGSSISNDWLIDTHHQPVDKPTRFYNDPREVNLLPLGGSVGYKGFALGLAVELLAGIVTGAGFAKEGETQKGNGGLFIAFDISLFNRQTDDVFAEFETLVHYLKSAKRINEEQQLRMPGELSKQNLKDVYDSGHLTVSKAVWHDIHTY